MKKTIPQTITPLEQRRVVLPILLGFLLLLGTDLVFYPNNFNNIFLPEALKIIVWLGSALYIAALYKVILLSPRRFQRLRWVNTASAALGTIALQTIFPDTNAHFYGVYVLLAVTFIAILSGRLHALVVLVVNILFSVLFYLRSDLVKLQDWLLPFTNIVTTLFLLETILQFQHISQARIQRLRLVNQFAQQCGASLNREHVLSTLKSTIEQAIRPDTYFAGILEGEMLHLVVLFDQGEYFDPVRLNIKGTLSGWVIRNNTPLFISDLREEPPLEDIEVIQIGKEALNLCWLGVPMKTPELTGILVVASYTPNAFNQNDIELVENLAQHTAQALGNTFQHEKVEQQSRLDSLTGVYHHGYLLKILEDEALLARRQNRHLSLVMMDIDYFKQYNDTYGHMIGDTILVSLCNIIRRYIKKTDSVGRWGGEEFAIVLPNANGLQTLRVSQRIQDAMRKVDFRSADRQRIPAPTISQGIALFPDEADNIDALIQLADRRLYIAKARGRNQIEPGEQHWQKLKME
jgi:diguanylate cyclase (GGDEF)-like protein